MPLRPFLPWVWLAVAGITAAISRRTWRAVLIAAVVGLHLQLHWNSIKERVPAVFLGNYPHSYSRSLSLAIGMGYQRLPLAADPVSLPLKRFLDMQQESLSVEELDAYKASLPTQTEPDLGNWRPNDNTRVGDLYFTALVWKVCGVNWTAFHAAYLGISALACLAVLLASWRISGRLFTGLLAGFLHAWTPYESTFVERDASPIWFVAFAVLAFCFLRERRTLTGDCIASLVLGVTAVLGYGWRPHLLLLVPIFFVAALVRWWNNDRGWKQMGALATCFIVGAGIVLGLVKYVLSAEEKHLYGNGFHVAYIGEQNRTNNAGVENDLQVGYDDSKVASDALAYGSVLSDSPIVYLGQDYATACRNLYLKGLEYHLYYWMRDAPRTLYGILANYQQPGMRRYWGLAIPIAVVIGCFALGFAEFDRLSILLLVVLSGQYMGIWYGISPDNRLWGVFLVPICILASCAPVVLLKMIQSARSASWHQILRSRGLRIIPAAFAGVFVLWLLALAGAFKLSAGARAALWSDIKVRNESSADASQFVSSLQTFAVNVPEGSTAIGSGYWLEIESGDQPGELLCKHLRLNSSPLEPLVDWDGNPPGSSMFDRVREAVWWNSFLETRHPLIPGKKQVFFVTCARCPSAGDSRSYSLKVHVGGDARIVAARHMDLSDWKHPQVSSLFQPDEPWSTTPYVGGVSSRADLQFSGSAEKLASLGFPDAAVAQSPAVDRAKK